MNWAVAGWTNTLAKLNYDADVVFLGDSITRGSDFREYFPDKRIVNLGYAGDTISGMTERANMVGTVDPELVFVMGGVNELNDKNVDDCVKKYAQLLDKLRDVVPNADIYAQSVLPVFGEREKSCHNATIKDFNEKIEQLAYERKMGYVDLYVLYVKDGIMNSELSPDGVHIIPEAYGRWADAISEYIEGQ